MNRMDFFEKVILGGTDALQKSLDAYHRNTRQMILTNTRISAFRYYDGPLIADMLETGLLLRLSREPGNRFDPQAVEVYAGDAKLGYISHTENSSIAWLMDTGIWVKARITSLFHDDPFNVSVEIEVWHEREAARN